MELRSLFYAFPYAIVFIAIFFLSDKELRTIETVEDEEEKYSIIRDVRFLAVGLLIVFIGLRGHVYTDFLEYYNLFDTIPLIWNLNIEDFNMEPGFIIYTSLFKTVIPNYYCWVLFNTIFDLTVFFFFFRKYTKSVVFAFLVFLAYQGLYIEFNLYRNAKAISLFLLSIPFLEERRLWPYLLLNILGGLFHVGAFMLIPLYFFVNRRWSPYVLWGLFGVANFCFFFQFHITTFLLEKIAGGASEYLAYKASKYAGFSDSYGLSFGYLEKSLIIVLIILLYNKLTETKTANIIFCNCSVIFYFITFFFADISILTERLSYQFIFALWLVLAELLFIDFSYKRIVVLGIVLLMFMRLVESNMTAMCYYDNLLWGIMDTNQRSLIIGQFD